MNEDEDIVMDDETEIEITIDDDEDDMRHAPPIEDTLADPYIPDEAA
jgi:hypothetical protein